MISQAAADELEARIFGGMICPRCGQPFKPISKAQRYCKKACKTGASWDRFRDKTEAQGKECGRKLVE